jgi:hypothetical protein
MAALRVRRRARSPRSAWNTQLSTLGFSRMSTHRSIEENNNACFIVRDKGARELA